METYRFIDDPIPKSNIAKYLVADMIKTHIPYPPFDRFSTKSGKITKEITKPMNELSQLVPILIGSLALLENVILFK